MWAVPKVKESRPLRPFVMCFDLKCIFYSIVLSDKLHKNLPKIGDESRDFLCLSNSSSTPLFIKNMEISDSKRSRITAGLRPSPPRPHIKIIENSIKIYFSV